MALNYVKQIFAKMFTLFEKKSSVYLKITKLNNINTYISAICVATNNQEHLIFKKKQNKIIIKNHIFSIYVVNEIFIRSV